MSGAAGMSADDQEPSFDAVLDANFESLSPSAQKVMRYISANRVAAISSSAAEIGLQCGASDASVVRAARATGFTGLAQLRQRLAASIGDEANPADNMRRTRAEVGAGVDRAVAAVIETHRESLQQIAEPAGQAALVQAIRTLHACDRILVFGIGPSAPLSEYVTLMLRRHGRAAQALNATGSGLADQLVDLAPGDGVLVLAYGRTYPEVVLLFAEGARLRLPIVLVTDSLEPKLARQAQVVVPARRGRHGRVAMHGATLAALEAIVFGLAFADADNAVDALARIGDLRSRLG